MARKQVEEFERREESLQKEIKRISQERRETENELQKLRENFYREENNYKTKARENAIELEYLQQ